MPKASRGRRPAPNPKKKSRQAGSMPAVGGAGVLARPAPIEAPPAYGPTSLREPVAERLAPSGMERGASRWEPSGASRRRVPGTAVVRRRFIDSIGDYWYVGEDLRRIGVLAGGLVCLLVVLSFVVR